MRGDYTIAKDKGNIALGGTHVARAMLITSGCFIDSQDIGVFTHPGATQLTRPYGASLTISFLSERVRPYIIATKRGHR